MGTKSGLSAKWNALSPGPFMGRAPCHPVPFGPIPESRRPATSSGSKPAGASDVEAAVAAPEEEEEELEEEEEELEELEVLEVLEETTEEEVLLRLAADIKALASMRPRSRSAKAIWKHSPAFTRR